jgi:type I restriction enzyme M protein
MTLEGKVGFLNAYPSLLDDIQAIDSTLGREVMLDWNKIDKAIKNILKKNESKWKAAEYKLFRDVFTKTNPKAEKVKKGKNDYEPDSGLRDYENIPLERDIDDYFKTEVLPHVPDAWMDRTKDKVGYEINFNRYFYLHTRPRSLHEIDIDLKKVEQKILELLNQVTDE